MLNKLRLLVCGFAVLVLTIWGSTAFITQVQGADDPTVTSLTLINADTDQVITSFDPLVDNAVIDLSALSTNNFNIEANTSGTVGSVIFSGSFSRTENVGPYTLFGDYDGDYFAQAFSIGTYTVTATPYTSSNGGGAVGNGLTVDFTVIDGATLTPTTTPTSTNTPTPTNTPAGPTNTPTWTPTPSGCADTLITNGCFETGDLSSWIYSSGADMAATTGDAAEGNYKLEYSWTAGVDGFELIRQDIDTTPAITYTIVLSYKNVTANGGFLLVLDSDSSNDFQIEALNDCNGGSYCHHETSFTALDSDTTFKLNRIGNDGSFTIYVDSIQVYQGAQTPTPTPTPSNTPTPTSTPTISATLTPTATPTPTPTIAISNTWQIITTSVTPNSQAEYAFAYDSQQDVAVLYGGTGNGWPYEDGIWEFDGSNWSQIPVTTSVQAVYGMKMVSTSAGSVLFGGQDSDDNPVNETAAYDGTNWQILAPSTSPSARTGHALAYDSVNDTVYLFGGRGGSTYYSDLWAYDPQTNVWSQLLPLSSPSTRMFHTMAYANGKLWLFGGQTAGGTLLNDLWSYDIQTNTWSEVTPAGTLPVARKGHSWVYHQQANLLVLFGGTSDASDTLLADTWLYIPASNSWQEATPLNSPPESLHHTAIYDDLNDRIIIFINGQTWIYQ